MKKIKAFFIGAAICFAAVCIVGCAQDSDNGNASGNKGTVETVDIETIQVTEDECTEIIDTDKFVGALTKEFSFGEWEGISKEVAYYSSLKVESHNLGKFVVSNGKVSNVMSLTRSNKYTYNTDEDAKKYFDYVVPSICSSKLSGNYFEYSITLNTNNIRDYIKSCIEVKDYPEDEAEYEREKMQERTDTELLLTRFDSDFDFEFRNYIDEEDGSSEKWIAKKNTSNTKYYIEKEEAEPNYSIKTIYTYRKVE